MRVAYVVDRAVDIAGTLLERRDADLQKGQDRLGKLEGEIENLIDLERDTGSSDRVAPRIRDLEDQADELKARLSAGRVPRPNPVSVRAEVERHLSDLRDLFDSDGRKLPEALLGEDRLSVGPDPEFGFRATGTLWLDPKKTPASSQRTGGRNVVVAGVRFGRMSPGLPLAVQFPLAA